MKRGKGLAWLLLAIGTSLVTAQEITRDEVPALLSQCQQQREARIAPLRTQAIENCVNEKRKDRSYCENYYRTYGNAKRRSNGTMMPGMFWDLPVCEQAVAAEKYFKKYPSKGVFSP
ncbi:MAG: hypothetical protein AAF699_09460 [Pseudomonadota bacterium]